MNNTGDFDNVVFYDGECGFCSSSVQFILKRRKRDVFFIPLQSEKAKETLDSFGIQIHLDTIYYLKKNKVYDRSSAALRICLQLKKGYPLLFALYLIPKFLRDPFYNMVAKRRHTLKAQSCMLPSSRERRLFL